MYKRQAYSWAADADGPAPQRPRAGSVENSPAAHESARLNAELAAALAASAEAQAVRRQMHSRLSKLATPSAASVAGTSMRTSPEEGHACAAATTAACARHGVCAPVANGAERERAAEWEALQAQLHAARARPRN